MSLTTGWTSFSLALMLSVLVFSIMQVQKQWLTSSKAHIIFCGYLGSLLFTFSLTAIGNFESMIFGKRYQSKLAEVITSLVIAMISSGFIHRVCLTVCFLFSMISLYCISAQAKVLYPLPTSTHLKKKK